MFRLRHSLSFSSLDAPVPTSTFVDDNLHNGQRMKERGLCNGPCLPYARSIERGCCPCLIVKRDLARISEVFSRSNVEMMHGRAVSVD